MNPIATLVTYALLAALSAVVHCLLIFVVGGGQLSDWSLVLRYLDDPHAIRAKGLRQVWMDEIRTIERSMPPWRQQWLRAVSLILPVSTFVQLILLISFPIGTTGFGIASLIEIGGIILLQVPTVVMQFSWRHRRALGLLWILLILAGYLLPFGQALHLVPYFYMWNLLVPLVERRGELIRKALIEDESNTQSGSHIFVSYAHQDREDIFPDIVLLQQKGHHVWLDLKLNPGEDWDSSIGEKIESSRAVLVFLSRNALGSAFIPREIRLAAAKGKLIIPIYLEPLSLPPDWEVVGSLQSVFRYEGSRANYETVLCRAVGHGGSPRPRSV